MTTELARLIHKSGETIEEVARAIGVTHVAVSRWQTGKRPIPDSQALKLAKHFNVSPFVIKPEYMQSELRALLEPVPPEVAEEMLAVVRAHHLTAAFKEKYTSAEKIQISSPKKR